MLLPPGESSTEAEQRVTNRPIVDLGPGYVGSDSCRECHVQEHQSWYQSYHRTMTQTVSQATAPAAITNTRVEVEGELFVFKNDGDRFTVELNDPNLFGKRTEREMVLMTGSHHMNVFWYESDFHRTPAQLPIVYLIEDSRWIPRRSAFLRPPDLPKGTELGRWNQTCSSCHSTNPRQRLHRESRIWDTHVAEFGISCEACHGPAEQHVKIRRDHIGSVADDPIVNPRKLSAAVRSDVCGQCHGVSITDFTRISEDDFLTKGCGFLPGDSLSGPKPQRIVRARVEDRSSHVFKTWDNEFDQLESSFWRDGEVRVSGREFNGLIESPCYSSGDFGCISCHQLHERDPALQEAWRNDQLKPGMRSNQACVQCHDTTEPDGTATYGPVHTHHALGSTGSNCMNCHMPHTVYGLLKTIRSHRISNPSATVSLETGRANACNLCHLDQSIEWTARHLNEWYGQPIPEIDADQRETAASVYHLLTGDAGQRAIQVSAMSWPPAQAVSGTDWMPPFLLQGLDDPYDAVRIISHRSLMTIPGWTDFIIDPLGPIGDRNQQVGMAMGEIEKTLQRSPQPSVLFNEAGHFDTTRADRLLQGRNHLNVHLLE